MNTPEFVSVPDALEIVFANRNKAYGAYRLRREYPANLGKALGLSLLLIGAVFLFSNFMQHRKNGPEIDQKYLCIFIAPPKIDIPPPPKIETPLPPPPAMHTVAFPPPIVDADDHAPDQVKQNAIDELLNTKAQIGTRNQDGDDNIRPDLPADNTGRDTKVETNAKPEETMESYSVQKMPSFPGGDRELLKYLALHIEYPAMARENGIQGPVVLTFVVNKDGSISDVAVLKDIGGYCGKEAVRVIQTMPRWSPGENNGHPVRVRFTLPVRFTLN